MQRTPAGRETLAAIVDELATDQETPSRPRLETINYEDRPPTAPRAGRPPVTSSPEVIAISEASVGRATQAAIEDALAAELLGTTKFAATQSPEPAVAQRKAERPARPAEVFEISTFVIRGEEIFTKASEQARRQYVETRLMHRLPALSIDEVVRIDVSRGAEELTVIMRVWCRVGPPP